MKKSFTLWHIITSNIIMMKKILFSSLFLLSSLVSQAQHEYTIQGLPIREKYRLCMTD